MLLRMTEVINDPSIPSTTLLLTALPRELLERILSATEWRVEGLCRLATVCRAFRTVSRGNLWTPHYAARWIREPLPGCPIGEQYIKLCQHARDSRIFDQCVAKGNFPDRVNPAEIPFILRLRNSKGMTLLHLAVRNWTPSRHSWLVKLINSDANVNEQTLKRGETPLHLAVLAARGGDRREGRVDLRPIRALLRKGAKCDTLNFYGLAPLHLLTYAGGKRRNVSVRIGAESAVALAPEVVKACPVDVRSAWGETSLFLAASRGGPIPVMEWLLQNGADPLARDEAGRTPLHAAVAAQLKNVVSLLEPLLLAGADPLAPDDQGKTPLDLAYERGDPEILAALEAGAAVKRPANGPVDCADAPAEKRARN
jgi:Ankyrin repeats (3 copies)/F-box-like